MKTWHLGGAAALVILLGPVANAQSQSERAASQPAAPAPDAIDEAHDTPPEHKPEKSAGAKSRGASGGASRPEGNGPSTRGVEIDEAHRTSPGHNPEKRPGRGKPNDGKSS